MTRTTLLVLLFLATGAPSPGQSLPHVSDTDWPAFRTHCLDLLKNLEALPAPLPAETVKAIKAHLKPKPDNPDDKVRAVEKLLDEHCLVGVHINPESRVKAARGARKAELKRDEAAYVLVKVHNEGGVTHRLTAASDQAVAGKKGGGRWVELAVLNDRPFADRLTGQRLEYRVLRLTARQAGKREATLTFDAGQGTQDLGFRAEVPILFTVRPAARP